MAVLEPKRAKSFKMIFQLEGTIIIQYYVNSIVLLVAFYISSFSLSQSVAEYLGEKLADLFGITSPRYGYVVDEWERIQFRVSQWW